MPGSLRLAGRVAVVTGAARGIGRAIAVRYGAEGARVVVNDVDATGAEGVARDVTAAGGMAVAAPGDVSDVAHVDRIFDATLARFGTVDVLVNNAGLTATERHFLDSDVAWWDRILAVNLRSMYLYGVRAARIMAPRRAGVILNMSSGGASRAHRGNGAYDAAKGGVEALTRAMALDLAPYGIRVNGLVPGSINTGNMSADTARLRGAVVPAGRVGAPDDLAGPAVFLASDDARYVTGHLLVVDGGLLAQQRSATVDIFSLDRFPTIEAT